MLLSDIGPHSLADPDHVFHCFYNLDVYLVNQIFSHSEIMSPADCLLEIIYIGLFHGLNLLNCVDKEKASCCCWEFSQDGGPCQ